MPPCEPVPTTAPSTAGSLVMVGAMMTGASSTRPPRMRVLATDAKHAARPSAPQPNDRHCNVPSPLQGGGCNRTGTMTNELTGGEALARMIQAHHGGAMFGMGGFQLLPFYDA